MTRDCIILSKTWRSKINIKNKKKGTRGKGAFFMS